MDIKKETTKQVKLAESIQKILSNIKKDSSSRKNQEYINKKRQKLATQWREFSDQHKLIVKNISSDHEYIKSKYYEQVELIVHDIETVLCQYEAGLGGSTSTITNESTHTTIPKLESIAIRKQRFKMKTLEKLIEDTRTQLNTSQPTTYVEFKKNTINNQWLALQELHEEIMVQDMTPEEEIVDDQYEDIQLQVEAIMKLLHEHLDTSNNDKIRLPHINIPIFNGNYENWTAFHDLYVRFIHDNKKLCNVEKMQYLKTSLKGDASKLLHHLNITDGNYNSAWELLNNRYNNKRLLVATHIANIFKLPKMAFASAEEIKEIHDTTLESLRAISNIGVPTDTWGPLIAFILQEKLDRESIKLYEQSLKSPKDIPQLEELMSFLESRFQSIEMIKGSAKKIEYTKKKEHSFAKTYHTTTNQHRCVYCKESHLINYCTKFADLSIQDRNNFINKIKYCINCLAHPKETQCKSVKTCFKCNRKHHTLLHFEKRNEARQPVSSNVSSTVNNTTTVLLATALIKAKTYEGTWEYMRALIDPGSQTSFITEEAAETLALPKNKASIQITGVGSTGAGTSSSKITASIKPRTPSNFTLSCELLILKKLTSSLPTEPTDNINMKKLNNCVLADPTFNTPGPIDIMIGADIYPMIIKDGLKRFNGYLAQNTEFGWAISGKQEQAAQDKLHTISMVSTADEKAELSRFWEMEELQPQRIWSHDDIKCDELYEATTTKADNKYIVKLPLKEERTELGDSRKRAMARLLQMERKFQNDPQFAKEYRSFMEEYEKLGHMVLTQPSQNKTISYYIPHHAVLKHDSTTTKLRVVFDASAKTTSGKSLNELMYTGPRLQQNLAEILLRWRKHRVALSADIEKMYRQIGIHPDDQPLQTVLWRNSADMPIQEYRLTTVTYGTSSAPYLAVRTLQQLAKDEVEQFTLSAQVVQNDFYVDDLITGCDNVDEAKTLQRSLIDLLQRGSFNLRKWKSNSQVLVETLPKDLQEKEFLEMGENDTKKTLGIHWAPITDEFKYQVTVSIDGDATKRKILSQIAKLYDPLGWLTPITIIAKLLVQNLWLNEEEWDDPLPPHLQLDWKKFQEQLPSVAEIKIPRWIKYDKTIKHIELHGFCDASEQAYGGVLYTKVTDNHGQQFITLLTAKSKVAPLKMKKTLARLELCSAVLLSKLIKQSAEALSIDNLQFYAWTDSMITLAWIQGEPNRWKTFVANRVVEIIGNTQPKIWRHVRSEENPADLITRGVMPQQLKEKTLWWNGPSWLQGGTIQTEAEIVTTTEEMKKARVISAACTIDSFDITNNYSSLKKLTRVIGYCLRFGDHARHKVQRSVALTTDELTKAHNIIIRMVQQRHFVTEINALNKGQAVNKQSSLITLLPFLDQDGLIRVGGRLGHSSLTYNEKHPIVIPHGDSLATLIIQDAHEKTLHGGVQLTLAVIRQRYWIIKGKSLVQQCTRKCVKCFRVKATSAEQVMGNLPQQRVTASPPFSHTGIDYAGPIQVRTTKGRGNKSYKGYIAIFVCMSTKAIHLEAVSDMTTSTFLAALRRFEARRGHCAHIYSDNGTNFVGAKGVLDKELSMAIKQPEFLQSLASDGTQWHFSPPAAPHFGGLWEAGVKSTKYHLKRVVGDNTLTFEELATVLAQIEACLNSRPLCVVNNSPNDNTIITPGHLLIGRSLVTQPDTVDLDNNVSIVTRWKLVQKMKRDFWKVWSTEYLHRLQQRYKWNTPKPNINPGDVVIVKDENLSPTKWPLARIEEVHPGQDSRTRVVTLRTQGGAHIKRPLVKVCPLPINETINMERSVNTRQQLSACNTIVYVLFCLLNIIPSCRSSSYTIKTPTPGLYAEHIGNAVINRGILRIDIPINTTILMMHDLLVNNTINQYSHVCQTSINLGAAAHCQDQVVELQQQYMELQHQLHVIQHGYGSRRKRGILGQVLTSVFGVNDEVYTDIEKLDKNQKQLLQTSQHQTSIMLKTLTSLNTTEHRINKKLEQFTKRLNHGLKQIEEFDHWYKATDFNTISIQLISIHQLAQEVISDLHNIYSKLLRVIHHQGHIVDFLTVGEFHRILTNVTNKLPHQFKIVTQPMKSMELNVSDASMTLFVYLYIAEKPKYTILSITPLAHRVKDDVSSALQVSSPLIAVGYDGQHYFEISDEELHYAVKLGPEIYLCTPNVIHDLNSAPNCAINVLYSRPPSEDCSQHTFTVSKLLWKHLYKSNTWMFIANIPTRVDLRCNEKREDLWLNNTGILQIDPTCTVDTGRNLLIPKITTNIKGISSFHKPLSVNLTNSFKRPIKQGTTTTTEEPIFSPNEEFASILHDESVLRDNFQSTIWETIQPHIPGAGIGILTTVVIVTIICGVVWILHNRKSTPTPTFRLVRQDVQP